MFITEQKNRNFHISINKFCQCLKFIKETNPMKTYSFHSCMAGRIRKLSTKDFFSKIKMYNAKIEKVSYLFIIEH